MNDTALEQIDILAENAHKAFLQYRLTKAAVRISFLTDIANAIDRDRHTLIETASRETHLPYDRIDTEVTRTVNQLLLFANLLKDSSWVRTIIDKAQPDRKPLPKPDLRQIQHPIGPVAVFGASNFPFAYSVCGGDTVAALAAGCTVVYKTNPGHPLTSEAVANIVIDSAKRNGLPDGTFSIIYGATPETGIRLVTHPRIKAVGFTGSLKGGRALFDVCAKRDEPIPVYAEMGSTNPVFILPQIMEQKGKDIARQLASSNTSSVGQYCTNPGIMIAQDNDASKNFYDEFASQIKETPTAPMLTPSIFSSFEKSMNDVEAKSKVAVVAISSDANENNARAHMFKTSGETFLQDHQLWEEMFGPSSVQVTATNIDEMMRIAEALPGQLTASVWGTEQELKENISLIRLLELKAGRLIINGVPTGVEVTAAMNHGGPYPSTTDSKFTSVGTQSIYRFTRPVCYQNFPDYLLPDELKGK